MWETEEGKRLHADQLRAANWKRWGPYLAERQWGTVREDYSPDGSCWGYFTHDHARARAYRWGEDGLLGFTDRECRLCFALALWNEKDPILKERLFGLTGPEGNHGEDVKELYYYLASTPTHSFAKARYRYPQSEYPYQRLVDESHRRTRQDPEFEITDAGVFEANRFFDVDATYAKAGPNDTIIEIEITNRGPHRARIHVLPTLWFRNTWSWGRKGKEGYTSKPLIKGTASHRFETEHDTLEPFVLELDPTTAPNAVPLFTENETNIAKLFGSQMASPFVKDSFHDYVIHNRKDGVNPELRGTKAAFHSVLELDPGRSHIIRLRLYSRKEAPRQVFDEEARKVLTARSQEYSEFYKTIEPPAASSEERSVYRQAYAGLLWSKQFYHYSVREWLEGDPTQPPANRINKRNAEWTTLYNRDVISMPDKWEYPWYAAWDLAFHTISLCKVDPEFAKQQLILLLREWYMHPNGQMPAYEFAFSDVNPPVHAWACWRVYKITGKPGERDRVFLSKAFKKLLINFTWWVNRKDVDGKNLFSGGFLGLDNIGVFDRGQPLPTGGHLEQADGTAWMAFFCGTMLSMALELAKTDPSYEDLASKFFEHFISITDAMNNFGGTGLWDEQDGFYYDQIRSGDKAIPLRLRSLVGLIPLLAVEVLDDSIIERLPGFTKRMNWFLHERDDLARHISYMAHRSEDGKLQKSLLAIPSEARLRRMLKYIFDESEFLSPYGIRSLSRAYANHPYVFKAEDLTYSVSYVPGESTTAMFGGNSNWRGPIWFPINYLFVEALERYHHFYGPEYKVEYPTGSGQMRTLQEISVDLSLRLTKLFLPNEYGQRPCHGADPRYAADPAWKDLILFHEYFHGDSGAGLGASHQTGWTALVTRCLERTKWR